VYARNTVRLAAQLPIGLAISSTVNVVGVVDCAGALQAILTVPMDWFKVFLAFNCLARALI